MFFCAYTRQRKFAQKRTILSMKRLNIWMKRFHSSFSDSYFTYYLYSENQSEKEINFVQNISCKKACIHILKKYESETIKHGQ